MKKKIINEAINYARTISAETITKAKSGHTGSSVGAAAILFTLFKDHYNFLPSEPDYINRDRFILSAGHLSPLYYTLMHMFDMDMSLDDLKNFRKLGSKTAGHPEYKKNAFIETTTGPLGQGVANAVGMALAQTMVASRFNVQKIPIINNYTYCFVGDGCLMEGIAQEAISFAGAKNLNKLILLYDSNNVTIDGTTKNVYEENVARKFKAQNWNVIKVRNGNNYNSITNAIGMAKKSKKPTIIIFTTNIGYKTEYENSNKIHGKPLTQFEVEEYKIKLNTQGSFFIPKDVKDLCYRTIRKNNINRDKWSKSLVLYETTHPDLHRQFMAYYENKKVDIDRLLKSFKGENMSGREANHLIINTLAIKMPRFVGGSADVANSTMAYLDPDIYGTYSKYNRKGKNIMFGIREHAMSGICNGISLYMQSASFCSTFLSFANYLYPSLRLSALMSLPVLYFFSHDNFKNGEDGPSHQPVENIGQLRLYPNLNVFRPCDCRELLACYKLAFQEPKPSVFIISKQTQQEQNGNYEKMQKGGYVLVSDENPEVVIYATGSEVELAMQTKEKLNKLDISVCVSSFPCLNIFDNQAVQYKNTVLCKNAKLKVVIEASNDNSWYKYISQDDLFFGINSFAVCGKAEELEKHYSYNATAFARKIKAKLN